MSSSYRDTLIGIPSKIKQTTTYNTVITLSTIIICNLLTLLTALVLLRNDSPSLEQKKEQNNWWISIRSIDNTQD